jgi:general control protein GCN4
MSRTSSSRHSTKSTSSKPRFKDIPDPLAPNTPATVVKRVRNTLAARRYRAKKVERMEQLEEQLAEMEAERDRWKNEAMQARLEAEKWKGMWVGANMGGNVNVNHHG